MGVRRLLIRQRSAVHPPQRQLSRRAAEHRLTMPAFKHIAARAARACASQDLRSPIDAPFTAPFGSPAALHIYCCIRRRPHAAGRAGRAARAPAAAADARSVTVRTARAVKRALVLRSNVVPCGRLHAPCGGHAVSAVDLVPTNLLRAVAQFPAQTCITSNPIAAMTTGISGIRPHGAALAPQIWPPQAQVSQCVCGKTLSCRHVLCTALVRSTPGGAVRLMRPWAAVSGGFKCMHTMHGALTCTGRVRHPVGYARRRGPGRQAGTPAAAAAGAGERCAVHAAAAAFARLCVVRRVGAEGGGAVAA